MRATFTRIMEETLARDPLSALILGDIGVYGFRESLRRFPDRVFNIGILEQASISMAAGLSMSGMRPVVHTIAPFLVERALEQIKVDLAYNELPARLVSVGASFDYAGLGATHHCPGDVMALTGVPGVAIVVPGTPAEFEALFRSTDKSGDTVYFRLSEQCNEDTHEVEFGYPVVLKRGTGTTVVSVGTTGQVVANAIKGLDVSHVYLTTLRPLQLGRVRELLLDRNVVIVEPFYQGSTLAALGAAMPSEYIKAKSIGVPHAFLRQYGSSEQHWEALGMTTDRIRREVRQS